MNTNHPGGKKKWIVLAAVLAVLVCGAVITTVVVSNRLGRSDNDDDAIGLVQDAQPTAPAQTPTDAPAATEPAPVQTAGDAPSPTAAATTDTTAPTETEFDFRPGFEVYDDEKVWSTQTNVEIFHLSYEDGEGIVTVNSENGDKLIAPGTENDYTFRLKNTGNCAMDYTMSVEAYFSNDTYKIPVEARMKRYDGSWLIGSDESYEDVLNLNKVSDSATLGVNRYAYYTLEWCWPFETGHDEYDTMLGDLSAEGEDLSLTIVIRTYAEANPDPNAGDDDHGGLPFTGDSFPLLLCVTALCVSAALIVVLLLGRRRKRA